MEASHPEPGTLHAWVEGELDSAEHERVEAHLAECAQCREAVAEARGLIAGASRIVAALDGAPAGVVPRRLRRPRFVPARWAAAAAVLLFAATSLVVSREFRSTGSELPVTPVETTVQSQQERPGAPASAAPIPAAPAPPSGESVRQSQRDVATSGTPGEGRLAELADGLNQAREGQDRGRAERAQPSVPRAPTADRQNVDLGFAGQNAARQVAGQVTTAAPVSGAALPPPPAPPPLPSPSSERREMRPGLRLEEVVVTGVATSSEARVVRVVRYEAEPGVVVTLTEYEEPGDGAVARARAAAPTRAQADVVRQESPAMLSARAPEGNVYSWRHPDGRRVYTLQGPLSVAELESLARRLGELKVVR